MTLARLYLIRHLAGVHLRKTLGLFEFEATPDCIPLNQPPEVEYAIDDLNAISELVEDAELAEVMFEAHLENERLGLTPEE